MLKKRQNFDEEVISRKTYYVKGVYKPIPDFQNGISGRLTTLRDSNEAEKEEPQPQNKRGKLSFRKRKSNGNRFS